MPTERKTLQDKMLTALKDRKISCIRLYEPRVGGPVTADHCVGSIAGVYKGFGVYYLVQLKDGSESWMTAEQLHRTYCCGH